MTSDNLKAGNTEISMQVLQHTVVLTIDGKELDLTVDEAAEFYGKLGNLLGMTPQWAVESTIWDHPTH